MKKVFALFAVLVVAVFVLNGYITQASNQDKFWMEAAQGGMAEVALGNLALQKSQNEQVRQFAQTVVDDHMKANDELKTLAASKNVTLPTDVNAKQKSTMNKLSGMSGADFDKEFIKMMVKDHEAMVRLFERQADRGTDADAKAFAAKTLPTLRSHLEMARTMSSDMKSMSKDRGADGNMNSNKNMDSNGNMNSNRNMNSNMNFNRDMDDSMNSNSNRNMNSNKNMDSNSDMMNSDRNMNSNGNTNMNSNSNSNRNTNSNRNMNSNSNTNRVPNINVNGF